MGWKRIALEVHCLHGDSEKGNSNPPAYCKYGPGHPDVHCLAGPTSKVRLDGDCNSPIEQKPCFFVGYSRTRTAFLLTNETGETESDDEFWSEDDLSNEAWISEERVWIEKLKKRLDVG